MRRSRLAVLAVLIWTASAMSFAQARRFFVPLRDVIMPDRTATMPVYLANGTAVANMHEVVGRASGTSPVTVTLSGLARFSSNLSYFCIATGADNVQTLGPQIVNQDGAHFQIVHASADPATVTYRCVGM